MTRAANEIDVDCKVGISLFHQPSNRETRRCDTLRPLAADWILNRTVVLCSQSWCARHSLNWHGGLCGFNIDNNACFHVEKTVRRPCKTSQPSNSRTPVRGRIGEGYLLARRPLSTARASLAFALTRMASTAKLVPLAYPKAISNNHHSSHQHRNNRRAACARVKRFQMWAQNIKLQEPVNLAPQMGLWGHLF